MNQKSLTPYLDQHTRNAKAEPSFINFETFIYVKAATVLQVIGSLACVVLAIMSISDGNKLEAAAFLLLGPLLLRLTLEAGVILFRIHDQLAKMTKAIEEMIKRVDGGGSTPPA
jgi:hypothetical protein